MNISVDTKPASPSGAGTAARRIVDRTRGRPHGPVTRLMSPSDLGRVLRPFVFLDHIDTAGGPREGFGLHPHSGIATVTWIMEGNVSYEDTTGETGKIPTGGLEWMRAGGGVWHGGGFGDSPRVRGFQLWLALPPELELGPAESIYVQPDSIEHEGPVTVLLGRFGRARSKVVAPSSINYLSVSLGAGERWTYEPPADHTVAWAAVSRGSLGVPGALQAGELAVFEESNASIAFQAETDVEFVLGSAAKHPHELVLGSYSVHTSAEALREGEARIEALQQSLRAEGRFNSR